MVFAEGHGSTDGNADAPLSTRPLLGEAEWPAVLRAAERALRGTCAIAAFASRFTTTWARWSRPRRKSIG